ncbi:glycosyltransferase family 2 protein [Devosia sp. SL43]|uniref:glycosyltransferase family 2 protein n=1 Tax=Devosia sp. SL43 TaxID=2806348 RepID=UPI001F1B297F|nr:glycosyltransferase family 2 protein [Devosia sp. SL43]UJW85863.1 glycosyltransferase family 2 protein [Devosia sp. SL43]
MKTADIDVIIVNFNAGPLLGASVQSAFAAGAGRVIVSDNGSTDGSIEDLANANTNPYLTIIRNGKNLGFAAGCNVGVKSSVAPNLLFLNPDCKVDGAALERLLAALRSDAKVGMVGGYLQNTDGSEQRGGRRRFPTPVDAFKQLFGIRYWLERLGLHHHQDRASTEPLPTGPVSVDAISGACMLIKTEAMEDVGPWDEGYFLHCEDLDLCKRFALAGWKVIFVPNAIVSHVKGASGGATKVFVELHKHRGMLRFYKKFYEHTYPRPMMWLVTIGVWCHFAAVALLSSLGPEIKPRSA